MTNTVERADILRLMWFCTRCFASQESGSWNHTCDGAYCYNCGSGGSTIQIPAFAVDSIRTNASWVGKRYYPCDEDKETVREIEDLRSLVPPDKFPGRQVTPAIDFDDDGNEVTKENYWRVTQRAAQETEYVIFTEGGSAEDALRRVARRLPYVSAERLAGHIDS